MVIIQRQTNLRGNEKVFFAISAYKTYNYNDKPTYEAMKKFSLQFPRTKLTMTSNPVNVASFLVEFQKSASSLITTCLAEE